MHLLSKCATFPEAVLPELPEVETMVRGIRPYVAGRKLARIRLCRTVCKPIAISPPFATLTRRIAGQTVTAVRRLGKRIIFDFSDGSALAIEPRMTGLVLLTDWPDEEHLRLKFEFDGDADYNAVWFWDRRGLGTVRHFRPGELEQATRLGIDALAFTPQDWQACLARTKRAVKVVLLDQAAVAGIGNLYASEILHVAGIDPYRSADTLSQREIGRLQTATLAVLEEAVRYEGSTLGDGTYRNALNKAGGYQNSHRVYQKHGQKCTKCRRGVIARTVQAQRATFHCPRCQK